ncbi:MOSC domain-containing protein [Luteolibacter marinus]|uniref:MOSC domain-containing protein n=1 Tax=Luteolibacter marinus TaxID=2776705 RepID=UPI001D004429|nr:MOSC N-terminal beta barrel domain-containing protein [Luteolibacter marinus]
MIRVSGLFLHPVKSLRGFPVDRANVDDLGLEGDRRFLVIDDAGKFLTQRTVPRMARVATALCEEFLHLSEQDAGSITVPLAPDTRADLRPVTVWRDSGMLAEDCGDDSAAWLGGVLGVPCRLVRIGPDFRRPVTRDHARPGDLLAFADGAPLLVTTMASLDELNRRIRGNGGDPVMMDRFRPNLVLEGTEPFAEDHWSTLEIAGVRFRSAGPCDRCVVTTADPLTGQRGKEPLATLAKFRRDPDSPSSVLFGVNLIQESKSGQIAVGDPVRIA